MTFIPQPLHVTTPSRPDAAAAAAAAAAMRVFLLHFTCFVFLSIETLFFPLYRDTFLV